MDVISQKKICILSGSLFITTLSILVVAPTTTLFVLGAKPTLLTSNICVSKNPVMDI